MKLISKFIVWILSLIFIFILVNLIIGLIKYKTITDYSQFLNQQDRQTVISQVSLKNPKSITKIFYGDVEIKLETQIEVEEVVETGDIINLEDIQEDVDENNQIGIDPYDPDFEEDFNSFFGNTNLDTPTNNSSNDLDAGFIADETYDIGESDTDGGGQDSVVNQLIEKFSE